MKLLLTSQMITNDSIKSALAELVGKPFAEARVAYIITSHNGAMGDKSWLMDNLNSIYRLGWQKFYMLDVAGMDGLPQELWLPKLEEADVIVMGGGANYILSYWLERAGLPPKLKDLLDTKVYVGSSAGSMLACKRLCTSSQAMKAYSNGNWSVDLLGLGYEGRSSVAALGLVDFAIRPHYQDPAYPYITDDLLAEAASRIGMPIYAIDDNSAIKVVGSQIEVVSEGAWRVFGGIG